MSLRRGGYTSVAPIYIIREAAGGLGRAASRRRSRRRCRNTPFSRIIMIRKWTRANYFKRTTKIDRFRARIFSAHLAGQRPRSRRKSTNLPIIHGPINTHIRKCISKSVCVCVPFRGTICAGDFRPFTFEDRLTRESINSSPLKVQSQRPRKQYSRTPARRVSNIKSR